MSNGIDRLKLLNELRGILYPPEMTKADSLKEAEAGLKLGILGGRTLAPAESTRAKAMGLFPEETPEEKYTGGLFGKIGAGLQIAPSESTFVGLRKEPSEKALGIGGLLGAGEITPAQADSMRSGLELGSELGGATDEERFGVTPWYLSDSWRDTEVGKAALEKSLKGGSIEDKLRFWTYIQKEATSSFGKVINEDLFNRASDEIDKLLGKEGGLIKPDTLKSPVPKSWRYYIK